MRTTAGGHRRYTDAEAERFALVRRLAEEGLPLREIQSVLRSSGDAAALAQEMESAAGRLEEVFRRLATIERRLNDVEARLSRQERGGPSPWGWFGRRR